MPQDGSSLSPHLLSHFAPFVDEVEALARAVLSGEASITADHPFLGHRVARELQWRVPVSSRRQMGAFFTAGTLRDGPFADAMAKFRRKVEGVCDPACGGGDLFVRWALDQPVSQSLSATLRTWSQQVRGCDLEPEFVRLARARLVLAAGSRVARLGRRIELEDCFPNITASDGLELLRAGRSGPLVLMNPPFTCSTAPVWMTARRGLTTAAATFVEGWWSGAREGDVLIALLPEVLRSGSSYRRWRESVEANAAVTYLEPLGQFDADVDIDVFLLVLERQFAASSDGGCWNNTQPPPPCSDLPAATQVSVGPVVPHRHREEGAKVPYVTSANLPRSDEASHATERRGFAGPLVSGPFVVIRRTSRPGQIPRAFPTVVTWSEPTAVENHLIVIRPSPPSISACHQIAGYLRSDEVTAWLNSRMRGRHLTQSIVHELLGESGG